MHDQYYVHCCSISINNVVPYCCSKHIIAIYFISRMRGLSDTHLITKDFVNIIQRKAGRHCLAFGFTIDL